MGEMDIDYQVLHDAFFKYLTKPKLTSHGDFYHEGKEFEDSKTNLLLGEASAIFLSSWLYMRYIYIFSSLLKLVSNVITAAAQPRLCSASSDSLEHSWISSSMPN